MDNKIKALIDCLNIIILILVTVVCTGESSNLCSEEFCIHVEKAFRNRAPTSRTKHGMYKPGGNYRVFDKFEQ